MEEVIGSIPIRSTKSFTFYKLGTMNGNLKCEVDRFHGRTLPQILPRKSANVNTPSSDESIEC
jgi:hypothetical protein